MLNTYKRISVVFFGDLVDKYIKSFKPLIPHLRGADIRILLKTWMCMIFLTTLIAYVASFSLVAILAYIFEFELITFIFVVLFIPALIASFVFLVFYIYPIEKSNNIKNSIEKDLPFALSHMAAIASSGIPPEFLFKLLIGFKEYGKISEQSEMILRNIKVFGMSSVSAIKDVAKKTPSSEFKGVLLGIVSTIEKGGNLVSYLRNMSDAALFDYKLRREKYLKTLSTYADIYTALLVAAPLILLSVLGILSIIGAEILGLSIGDFINLITFIVLPALNTIFLIFIHITYPGV